MIKIKKDIWLYATILSLLAVFVVEVNANGIIQYTASEDQKKAGAMFMIAVCLVASVVSLIAIFKSKRLSKIFAAFSFLLTLFFLAIAIFAYGFIGYGS